MAKGFRETDPLPQGNPKRTPPFKQTAPLPEGVPAPTPAPTPAPATTPPTSTPPGKKDEAPLDTPTAAVTPPTAQEIVDALRAKFGYLGMLLDHPDTLAVIQHAMDDPNLSQTQIMGELYGTDYFKNTNIKVRTFEQRQSLEPGSLNADIADAAKSIQRTAATTGITLTPDRSTALATDAVKFGWDGDAIKGAVGAEFQYQTGKQQGNIAAQEVNIKKMAADYLVPLSDPTLAEWDRQVASGTATADSFKQYIIDQAKLRFPTLANHLDNMTTQFLVDPYKQTAAQELGINPDTINFADAKWMRPLQVMDDKGNATLMSQPDWIKTIRSDSAYGWDKTQNGIKAGYSVANMLSKKLGLVG